MRKEEELRNDPPLAEVARVVVPGTSQNPPEPQQI